jgi:bacillithiol biosynthesis deacetylase BshB1
MPTEAIDFRADVLAIAAHRDDVEQTCGGTLLRMAARGLRTAILDLTQGEAGTRGTADERAREAEEAARILGVGWRQALTVPDGAIENTLENRVAIVHVLRRLRPRVVILPYWQARHPDHAVTGTLGYDACFLAGLKKVDTGTDPHRPFKIVYASLYADVRPSFVVDITPFIEQRHLALMAYRSQYANQSAGSGLFVPEEEIRERTLPRRAITDCSPVSVTASPLCKKKSASSTISRSCPCNRSEPHCVSVAEEHLSTHGDQRQRKDAPQHEHRNMNRADGPEVSAHKKAHRQQQRHVQIGVASAVVLQEGEQPHRRQQRAQRSALRLVLVHAQQIDQRGNEQNAAANAHHAGGHSHSQPDQYNHPGHARLL